MPNRDTHDNISVVRSVSPVVVGTTGTGQVGKIVDRRGYDGVEFIISYGTITATSATILPVVKEGDATGTMTSIADADLLGTEAGAGIAAAVRTSGTTKNVTKRLGYVGIKRYVSVNIVPTATAGPPVSASVLLTRPARAPVAT